MVFFNCFRGAGNTGIRASGIAHGVVASEAFFAAQAGHYRRGCSIDSSEPLADERNLHPPEAVL